MREVAEDVLRATFIKHQAIIFEGNGYSQEWRDEVRVALVAHLVQGLHWCLRCPLPLSRHCCCALCRSRYVQAKKRGLPIHATTADVLPVTTSDKNVALFTSLNIFSKEEVRCLLHGATACHACSMLCVCQVDVCVCVCVCMCVCASCPWPAFRTRADLGFPCAPRQLEARQIIDAGEYVTKIASEAAATVGLFNNFAAPAGFETQTKIASAIIAANNAVTGTDQKSQSKALAALSKSLSTGLEAAADLQVRCMASALTSLLLVTALVCWVAEGPCGL